MSPGLNMHNIADRICKHFQYNIEQKYDDNQGHIYYHSMVSMSVDKHSNGAREIVIIKC